MGIAKYAATTIATAFLAAQPCAAAGDLNSFNIGERAAFGGLKITMPFGQKSSARPTARLQLTSMYSIRDAATGEMRMVSPAGLEMGTSGTGKPKFYLNGQDAAEAQRRLGLGGSTGTTLLIVGGVLVALVVIGLAAGGGGFPDTCGEVGGSDDHCID